MIPEPVERTWNLFLTELALLVAMHGISASLPASGGAGRGSALLVSYAGTILISGDGAQSSANHRCLM